MTDRRQTDSQTDGRVTAYSQREREFMFANNGVQKAHISFIPHSDSVKAIERGSPQWKYVMIFKFGTQVDHNKYLPTNDYLLRKTCVQTQITLVKSSSLACSKANASILLK